MAFLRQANRPILRAPLRAVIIKYGSFASQLTKNAYRGNGKQFPPPTLLGTGSSSVRLLAASMRPNALYTGGQ